MRGFTWVAPVALLLSPGCFTVELYAPHGMEVTLLPSDEPTEEEWTWRLWYVLFGFSILENNLPADLIHREQLTEVRLVTEDNIPDAFHGFVYNVLIPIGLVNQTLVLQGNHEPQPPPSSSSAGGSAQPTPSRAD